MTAETKPKDLTPDEEWAWQNSEPGSWQRRALARAVTLKREQRLKAEEQRRAREEEHRRRESAGWESAVIDATLPGEHGLECIFYEYIARRTLRLRDEVYVTFVVEGVEFRPAQSWEHSPCTEVRDYQFPNGLFGGEYAYGEGRPLEVSFVCYSPEGSGAAGEAVREIGDALEKLREVAGWGERKRSWFGMRHGGEWRRAARSGAAAYRPPSRALPHRAGRPKAPQRPRSPVVEERTEIPNPGDVIRGHLERWGMAEDAERYGFIQTTDNTKGAA